MQISMKINEEKNRIELESKSPLSSAVLEEFSTFTEEYDNGRYLYNIEYLSFNSFVLYSMISTYRDSIELDEETESSIKRSLAKGVLPKVYVKNHGHILIDLPSIKSYEKLGSLIGAKRRAMFTWAVPFSRMYDVYFLLSSWKHPFLPSPILDNTFLSYINEELTEDKSLYGLCSTDIKELTSIKDGWRINPRGLEKLKIEHCGDLMLNRPKRYQDRIDWTPFYDVPFGEDAVFKGTFLDANVAFNGNKVIIEFTMDNGNSGKAEMWGGTYSVEKFKLGAPIYILGKKTGKNKIAAFNVFTQAEVEALPVAPEYPQSPTNKITSKVLTYCVREIFERFNGSDVVSYYDNGNKTFWEQIKSLHFPKSVEDYKAAVNYLAELELTYLQTILIDQKHKTGYKKGTVKTEKEGGYFQEAKKTLPFALTKDQETALEKIKGNLASEESRKMLLSADVGAGKTVVAQMACLMTADAGEQSVLLGPTEVLAKQLYTTFIELTKGMKNKPNIVYLSGGTSAKDKAFIEDGIKSGEIDIAVGTHSLLNVEYKNLGLICVDEEQKFGAKQREKLLSSRSDGLYPDMLSQTATPIPRSTALIFYGDVDLITIETKPKGRLPIKTEWIKEEPSLVLDRTHRLSKKVHEELAKGNKIFVITSAVHENGKTERLSAKGVAKFLKETYPDINIQTLYGGLSKDDQNKEIDKFKSSKGQVLVASSIVEVGVDVPEATVMIILNADNFGASSLHQIRGRVGRSDKQSYCYLVSNNTKERSTIRLNSLVDSNNGFEIALTDLRVRQQGDVLGENQSGESNLRFADLADHSIFIDASRERAEALYNSDRKEEVLKDAYALLKGEME